MIIFFTHLSLQGGVENLSPKQSVDCHSQDLNENCMDGELLRSSGIISQQKYTKDDQTLFIHKQRVRIS